MDLISRTLMMGSAGGVAGAETYWIAELSGADNTVVYGVTSDSSGNIYAIGSCSVSSTNRIFTVKYSKTGSLLWQRFITPTSFGSGNSICVDTSDNVYITGTSNNNVLVAKYSPDGTLAWQRYFAGPDPTGGGLDISSDSSNNIYVFGTYNGNKRAVFFKINSSGTLLSIGSEASNSGSGFTINDAGIVATSAGDNYSTFYIKPFTGNQYIYIAKRNSSMVLQWERRLSGTSSGDTGYAIDVDSSENVYAVATAYSSTGNAQAVIAKYNSVGTLQWQKALSTTYGFGTYFGIVSTGAGTTYCASSCTPTSSQVGFIHSRNTSGTLQWQRSLDIASAGTKALNFIDCTLNGTDSIVTCGYSTPDVFTSSTYKGLVVKLPNNGSRTGTYGSYTYAALSFTDVTTTLTATTPAISAGTGSSSSTPTLTEAAGTLTSSTIAL